MSNYVTAIGLDVFVASKMLTKGLRWESWTKTILCC